MSHKTDRHPQLHCICKYYTLKKITNQGKNSIIRKISLISVVAVVVALSCRSARRKLLGPPQMA